MRRCDLHAAGSKLLIDILIGNDRYLSPRKRKLQHLSYYVLVSVILGIHSDRRITKKRLRTSRGDLNESSLLADDRIIDMPEVTVLILMLHLRIGNGCLADRTPVYYLISFIYVALIKQLYKDILDSLRTALIHGKALSLPVSGRSELLELLYDPSAVFFLPLPRILEEFFAPYLFLIYTLALQALGNLHLRSDARVVCSRLPKGIVTLHALISYQNILHRIVESMPHVKLPGNIRRRHHYSKRLFRPVDLSVKITLLFPCFINAILHLVGIIRLCKFLTHCNLS